MKMMIKMLSIIALVIMAASCATTNTPVSLPSKYNLDAELQAVKKISTFRVTNWDQVDNQSFILTAAGGKKYLIVLDRPLDEMISNETIGISNQGSSIMSGYDKVLVRYSSGNQYYRIEKIYELDSKEQVKEIKKRLSSNQGH